MSIKTTEAQYKYNVMIPSLESPFILCLFFPVVICTCGNGVSSASALTQVISDMLLFQMPSAGNERLTQ